MRNKYLEREIQENLLNHEIFEHQTNEDLNNMKDFLIRTGPLTEIIVEFDGEKIVNSQLLYTFPYDSYKNNLIWEQLVAIRVIKELQEKLNVTFANDLNEMEKLIYESNEENYLMHQKELPTRDTVMEIIAHLNIPFRLHFINQYLYSECLCDELSKYMITSYPITMIYSDCEFYTDLIRINNNEPKLPIYDACDYFLFKEFEEGKHSKEIMLEKERKQKRKKYEEV